MSESVTQMLADLRDGKEEALPQLISAVQSELRSLAAVHLRAERPEHTLQATALVNEAYLRLVDQRGQDWNDKKHFLAIASMAMRRVLLAHARSKMAEKRGGGAVRVTLFEVASSTEDRPENVIALHDALERFAEIDPDNARIVELRWFGGLDVAETADVLGVSTRTVERGWRAAAAWLRHRIESDT